jgi:hypothetical protein
MFKPFILNLTHLLTYVIKISWAEGTYIFQIPVIYTNR